MMSIVGKESMATGRHLLMANLSEADGYAPSAYDIQADLILSVLGMSSE